MGSVERGHYIAFVRGAEQWFCIDDEEVRTVDWEAVALQKAYMLFYHAVPPPPPTAERDVREDGEEAGDPLQWARGALRPSSAESTVESEGDDAGVTDALQGSSLNE